MTVIAVDVGYSCLSEDFRPGLGFHLHALQVHDVLCDWQIYGKGRLWNDKIRAIWGLPNRFDAKISKGEIASVRR